MAAVSVLKMIGVQGAGMGQLGVGGWSHTELDGVWGLQQPSVGLMWPPCGLAGVGTPSNRTAEEES